MSNQHDTAGVAPDTMSNAMYISKDENGRNISAYDFETDTLYRIPDTSNKIALAGKQGAQRETGTVGTADPLTELPRYNLFDYFDSMQEFIESDKTTAVIPFFCAKRETKGKRYQVTVLTRRETIEFLNLEKVEGGWLKHESDYRNSDSPKIGIEICQVNSAYMFYVEKCSDSLNGVKVKSVKKLEKWK